MPDHRNSSSSKEGPLNISARKKVFLCYAKEDRDVAERMYRDLRKYGLEPWIDIESLTPGLEWREQIPKAIRECDFFVPLLSSRSVSKVGYVQKEIKIALDYLDEHPADQPYLIPIRLDDCQPSHRQLTDIQWVDLFPTYEYGLSKILRAILPDLSDSPFEGMRSVLEFITSNSSQYVGFYAFSDSISVEKADLLVGVGKELAQDGNRVVLADLELNTPQLLHSLRRSIPSLLGEDLGSHAGVAEILERHFAEEPNHRSIRVGRYLIQISLAGSGEIYLLPAGNVNSSDSYFRGSQDWQERLGSVKGMEIMQALRWAIKRAVAPDYVLISCPSGLSPLSNLSRLVLSDDLVFVWARNQAWSKEALTEMEVIKYRFEHYEEMRGKSVHFHPVFR